MHINQLSFVVNSNITSYTLSQSPTQNYFDFGVKVKELGGGGVGAFSSAGMRGRGVAMGLLDRGVN